LPDAENVAVKAYNGPTLNPKVEWFILAVIVLAAFAIRIYRLGDFPDTVLGDEADNYQSSVRILYGQDPQNGLFGVDWTQQPAFSVYKGALFIAVFGFNITALRLPSALISALALIPFYLLLRRQLSVLASFLACTLLAANVWYLNFSRSGWNCIDIAFYMLTAMLLLLLAQDSLGADSPKPRQAWKLFAWAGFACALGLYGYPAGRAITLAVAVFFPVSLFFCPRNRRVLAMGYLLLFGVEIVAFAPEAAYALKNWDRFNGRTNVVLIFNDPAFRADPVGTMLQQVSNNIRGPWDGRVNNTPQYFPGGEPQLDGLTGAFALAGMVLTLVLGRLRRSADTWLWWSMLLSGWALTQLITARTPNGARGIGYMPTLIYFAAVGLDALARTIDSAVESAGWPSLLRRYPNAVLALSVIVAAYWNVAHYVAWQSSPQTRQARYIYVTAREFPLWAADIVDRAVNNGGVTNLGVWRDAYPIQDRANPYGGSP
jgi:hypothetical protein